VSSKIGGVDSSRPTAPISAGRAAQRSQDAAAGGAQSSSDASSSGGTQESVQITGVARQLASLEQAVRDVPVINSSRVAQISNSIEQGTYTVNAQNIADKLVQTERELAHLGNQHQPEAESDAE
jgi:negative regulator of flagellin synthesis FlgM